MDTLRSCIRATTFILGGILILGVAVYVMKPPPENKPPQPQPQPPLSIAVDCSRGRSIPDTLFGIFFEEINHAGAGGLWAELVRNRGFEQGEGMDPWDIIGDSNDINATKELTSCFKHNKAALRMEVLSDLRFDSRVGIYNPSYWGMNIVEGHSYKVTLYTRSTNAMNVTVSFTSIDGFHILGSTTFLVADYEWKKCEIILKATGSNHEARLQMTTTNRGSIWFDQVSAMPVDNYKGLGFRNDLMHMLLNLKPRFLRFPGGSSIEGNYLNNSYRWKETVGPWEDRPAHFDDSWGYWSDNGLGYLEFLQLAEILAAKPVWVVNAGIATYEQDDSTLIGTLVQDMLDGIKFARGDINSSCGYLRAKYGHAKPFDLRYLAIGNEDCLTKFPTYRGNYLKFHHALKEKYPDINVINNCDPTTSQNLDVPAEMFEYHIYDRYENIFLEGHLFDRLPRSGAKVFVSEYAAVEIQHPNGNLVNALAEAGFLIGLERNSDVVSMASYAPLLMNNNDQIWKPDVIYFDTWRAFGSPSYWMQSFFVESSGSFLLELNQSRSDNCTASAIRYRSSQDGLFYVKVKIVNLQENHRNVTVTFKGVDPAASLNRSKLTVLTSNDPYDENS